MILNLKASFAGHNYRWFKPQAAFIYTLIFSISVFIFSSCGKSSEHEKMLKSLDSLSGALNQKLTELRFVDTVILQKAIVKYNNYKQFIQQNVNDTISKTEADHLQQFYNSGKNLIEFDENRKAIIARGNLINSQLNKLVIDAKENDLATEKLKEYTLQEKLQAEQLIKDTFSEQQLFNANLQEFKLSLFGVEELIKSRNNGQMPTIIKDTAEL